jgi:hypothetical protein
LKQIKTTRFLKNGASILLLVALALELTPKSLFDSEIPSAMLQYLVERSSWLANLQRDSESTYRGYGNKFALSYLMSMLAFCVVTIYIVLPIFKSNSRTQVSLPEAEGKSFRLLTTGIAATAIIFIQFAWPSIYLSHTKAGTLPFLSQSFCWILEDFLIASFLVSLRRGAWQNAV